MRIQDVMTASAIWIFFVVLLMVPKPSFPEFYRYVTKDGEVHYVDDVSNVPEDYLPDMKIYREPYDHLSENEKAIMMQKDRDRDAQRLQEEKQLREQREKESQRKQLETEVVIIDNQVLVPVTIGYGIRETQTLFLLDTGASHLVLFKDLAKNLNVKSSQKGVSMVAGGDLIETDLVVLDYLKLGPLDLKNVEATVIQHDSQTAEAIQFSGLLGMNILKANPYVIDFENKKILWQRVN